jgi:hypothetical protein
MSGLHDLRHHGRCTLIDECLHPLHSLAIIKIKPQLLLKIEDASVKGNIVIITDTTLVFFTYNL